MIVELATLVYLYEATKHQFIAKYGKANFAASPAISLGENAAVFSVYGLRK